MNPEKVLVDTSAWILSFRTTGNPELKAFLKNSITGGSAATAPAILLELIQGCRSKRERDALRAMLESLDMCPVTDAVWERSYELGFFLRRSGVTVPAVDLLMAAIAIENDFVLLHQDRHFEMIAKRSKLRSKSFA